MNDRNTPQEMSEALAELVDFADNLDKTIRQVLDGYCRHESPVSAPWAGYVRSDEIREFTLRAMTQGGAAIGALRRRLNFLHRWIHAGMVGWDSTMASVSPKLQGHLFGPLGAGSDPNCKVRDYVTQGGDAAFGQHMRELCVEQIAKAFMAAS